MCEPSFMRVTVGRRRGCWHSHVHGGRQVNGVTSPFLRVMQARVLIHAILRSADAFDSAKVWHRNSRAAVARWCVIVPQVVLSKMGAKLVHCGSVGNGQVAKLCNNLLLGICMLGTR